MSEQEMRNKMDFIVEQQAQFVIDLQNLQQEQAKAESRISRLEGAIVTVVNMIGELAKAQKGLEETVKSLGETVKNVAEKVDALTERVDVLVNMMVKRTLGENGEINKDGNN